MTTRSISTIHVHITNPRDIDKGKGSLVPVLFQIYREVHGYYVPLPPFFFSYPYNSIYSKLYPPINCEIAPLTPHTLKQEFAQLLHKLSHREMLLSFF